MTNAGEGVGEIILLMEMQISPTSMQISVKVPKKKISK